jgi:hypothetical protein
MNLIWHIVQKDLRRFWIPVALLALALFCKAELLMTAPNFGVPTHIAGHPGIQPPVPVALNSAEALSLIYEINLGSHPRTNLLLWVVSCSDFILLVVLVLGVLLEDPTMGDRTFWRTRPIAGWQMLAAKVVFIFLIGWPLQAAMQVRINFAEDTTAVHGYSALGQLTVIQAAWVSAFALAVLLWRNPVVGAGILAAIFFGSFVLVGFFPEKLAHHDVIYDGDYWGIKSLAILFCVTAAVAWLMYCRRKQSLGFLIFGAGVSAMALLWFL